MIRGQVENETPTEPSCVDLRAGAKQEDSIVRWETRTPPALISEMFEFLHVFTYLFPS